MSQRESNRPSRPNRLPFISELLRTRSRTGRTTGSAKSNVSYLSDLSPSNEIQSPMSDTGAIPTDAHHLPSGTIKYGELLKTSRSRTNNRIHGPPRRRRFRLTEEAIEYFQQFSHVKIRRSFPLTSIHKVQPAPDNPAAFQLIFHNFVMELEATSVVEANSWLKMIQEYVSQWNEKGDQEADNVSSSDKTDEEEEEEEDVPVISKPSSPSDLQCIEEDGFLTFNISPHSDDVCILEQKQDDTEDTEKPKASSVRQRERQTRPYTPGRTRSQSLGVLLKAWTTEDEQYGTYGQRRFNRSLRRRLHLVPKLEKHAPVDVPKSDEEFKKLHGDYAMIKYPRYNWWAIPSEKIFRVDNDNLQIMWRSSFATKTNPTSILRLDSVLEVRVGQRTNGFERFPYEEVDAQSFSLMYEDVKGKYAKLESLDVICDHPQHFQDWIEGLGSLQIGPKTSMFPSRYENTDPILLWLKGFWTCSQQDHEISERESIKIVKMIHPRINPQMLRRVILDAHSHQHAATLGYGKSLKWDGFVLLYNLLCGETGRLNEIFRKYAKTKKRLGMTMEEFKEFLIQECHWKHEDCDRRKLKELMVFHDHHHLSFKKYVGGNKVSNWKTSVRLLSYAGFLSFLRSRHNSSINALHNTVYQDMSQPLSHYFINSSHNTYLEADQIKGRSTLDAYIRALLQGSRCVEIDCWDNASGEPIIYHGFTFTSKLPLRAVVRTIKEYAFHMSHYPVIISIENHCNAQQQSKMAKIFHEEFTDDNGQSMIATENLVEGKAFYQRHLPSPLELQGKILLKGSYKLQNSKGLNKGLTKQSSSSIAFAKRNISGDPSFETLEKAPSKEVIDSEVHVDTPTGKREWDWPSEQTLEKGSVRLTRGRTRREAKQFSKTIQETGGKVEIPEDDQEIFYTETAEDLRRLIVYCRSTHINPWSWREQKFTSICQMFSFGEISAANHCKRSPKEMLACTERQLVRTYPKGARIDSSNYYPIPFWNHGIHMVALNYQTPDVCMHLNQGRFRHNGGCGYVLKPAVMRKPNPSKGEKGFNPLMTEPHPLVPTCDLEIELLSGQNLSLLGKSCQSLTVQISSHGIPADSYNMDPQAESADVFSPNWPQDAHIFSHKILMPELCLIYFRVDVTLSALGSTAQIFGQNCITLPSLQPGLKYIQLRKSSGELIPESGLFVKIKMEWDNGHIHSPLPNKSSPHPKLTHQDELCDPTQSLSSSFINSMTAKPVDVLNKPQLHRQSCQEGSLVNLLEVIGDSSSNQDVFPISNEIESDSEENGEMQTEKQTETQTETQTEKQTETQTVAIEITAETYDV